MTILYMNPSTYNRFVDHLSELELQSLDSTQPIRRIADESNYNEHFHVNLLYKKQYEVYCEWMGGNLDLYDPPAEIEVELVERIAHLLGFEKEDANSYRDPQS